MSSRKCLLWVNPSVRPPQLRSGLSGPPASLQSANPGSSWELQKHVCIRCSEAQSQVPPSADHPPGLETSLVPPASRRADGTPQTSGEDGAGTGTESHLLLRTEALCFTGKMLKAWPPHPKHCPQRRQRAPSHLKKTTFHSFTPCP